MLIKNVGFKDEKLNICKDVLTDKYREKMPMDADKTLVVCELRKETRNKPKVRRMKRINDSCCPYNFQNMADTPYPVVSS